jgi:hypothetical protein
MARNICRSEDLLDYVDRLELERDRLLLKCEQLSLRLHELDAEKAEDEHCDICYTCEHMCDIRRKYIGATMLSCVRHERRRGL